MFKFLHCADVHLDSPLKGLERYEGAPVEAIRQASRRAFDNLIQLAIDEKVAFVLIVGDLFDGSWKDYNTGLYFVSSMTRLRDRNIRVFVVRGNHDAQSRMSASLRLPDNVTVFSDRSPETHRIDTLGVALHGMSFHTASVHENISLTYPAAVPGAYNIGLLHTSATGSEDHDEYAPCSVEHLKTRGYDYWALGHVHRRQQLLEEPPIVFPGNVQGRHIRETGAKGCLVVTVEGGSTSSVEFEPVDVLRWATCTVEAPDSATPAGVLDLASRALETLHQDAQGRLLAVRVVLSVGHAAGRALRGNAKQLLNEVRALGITAASGDLWIEKVVVSPRGADAGGGKPVEEGPLQELMSTLEEIRIDEAQLRELGAALTELESRLPADLRGREGALSSSDPGWLRDVLDEAQSVLAQRLKAGGGVQ
ncbi:MAG: DNA repair exonuclease [Candidatus Riflebacteria bacterium]|nr:DNA repair exonuclease [Candidatus Riflebacteria bacterium]